MRSPRDLPWAESFLVLTLLAATVAVAWTGLGRPPFRLVFRYGPPPGGSPTGREREIRGLRFVEISPGYFLDLPDSARRPSSAPARFGLAGAGVYARWLGLGTDHEVRVATDEERAWARALGLILATEADTLRLTFGGRRR